MTLQRWLMLNLVVALAIFCAAALKIVVEIPPVPQAPPVIPPGRENTVMQWLRPMISTKPFGYSVSGVSIDRADIRLQLEKNSDDNAATTTDCELPYGFKAPGVIIVTHARTTLEECSTGAAIECTDLAQGDLKLRWLRCASGDQTHQAQLILDSIVNSKHDAIWELPREAEVVRKEHAGLLTPIVKAASVEKKIAVRYILLISMIFTLCTVFYIGAHEQKSVNEEVEVDLPRKGQFDIKDMLVMGAILLLGIGLRIYYTNTLPLDGDEITAGGYNLRVLGDDHDSWVHPPLYRAVHHYWRGLVNLHDDAASMMIRGPSLVFSSLAIVAMGVWSAVAGVGRFALIPFAYVCLVPELARESVLARPYGLGIYATVLLTLAISSNEVGTPQVPKWFSWFVALTTVGLTIWTDLIYGLIVGAILLAKWLSDDAFPSRILISARIITAMNIVLWAVPFALGLPGAIEASRELGWPFRSGEQQGVISGMWSTLTQVMGSTFFGGHNSGALTTLALLGVSLASVYYWKQNRRFLSMASILPVIVITVAATLIQVRPRNIVAIPFALHVIVSLMIVHIWRTVQKNRIRVANRAE